MVAILIISVVGYIFIYLFIHFLFDYFLPVNLVAVFEITAAVASGITAFGINVGVVLMLILLMPFSVFLLYVQLLPLVSMLLIFL